MDEQIVKRLGKFREKMNLKNVPDGHAFEQFVNYTILTGHQPGAFNGDDELFEKVNVNGFHDMGIDGLAIKINDKIIRNIAEAKSLVETFLQSEIEFIFIQSKYKEEFTKNEFISFSSGVRDFLSEDPKIPHSDKLEDFINIKDYLISDDIVCKWKDNPSLRLYYVTMAREHNSQTQHALAEQFKNDISNLKTYKEPVINFINSKELKLLFDSNDGLFQETITISGDMDLTEVEGVTNSCVLLCYANELKKLLKTPDGLIRKSLFNDNVRDYQGVNAVNTAIRNTIIKEPGKFVLLNNGITIICNEFITRYRKITITNPQIVNGCQTCHEIFENNEELLSKVPVIIKLISTKDNDITRKIVKGTNNQNSVPEIAFEATKPFHQELEEFINDLSPDYSRFYYERRVGQYDHINEIMNYQKINFGIIIQSFVSMFLNSPHNTCHNNYKQEMKLLQDYMGKIFGQYQSKYPYFTAALSYYELEALFREGIIDKNKFQDYKMYILMAFHELNSDGKSEINNEILIEKHCKPILNILKNHEIRKNKFQEACKYFEMAKTQWVMDKKKSENSIINDRHFSELLLEIIGNKQISVPKNEGEIKFGKIIKLFKDRHDLFCGKIDDGTKYGIYFHQMKSKDFIFEGKLYTDVCYKIEIDKITRDPVATQLKEVRKIVVTRKPVA